MRTTGVLFSDVLDFLDVPERFLMNSVRRVHIQPPDAEPLEISARAYRFYMADVTGMLRWMAGQTDEHGATMRWGRHARRLAKGPVQRFDRRGSARSRSHRPR